MLHTYNSEDKKPNIFSRFFHYLRSKITRTRIVILIILVAIIAGWRINAARKAVLSVQTTKAEVGNLTQSVSASGSVNAEKIANLSFPASGKIAWLGVTDGQSVKKYQALASLNNTVLNSTYEEAQNNLRNAEASLEATYDSLQGKAKSETFAEKATRTISEVAKDNAYEAVKIADYNLKNSVIYAPFGGVVTNFASGLSQGINIVGVSTVMSVVDPTTVYFEAEVNELDVPKIKLNQKVEIELDAYPNQTFEGVITNISFLSSISSTGGTVYKVKISLPENNNLQFRYGMEGNSQIILDTLDNVLLVPSSAIVETEGKTYVWLDENSEATKKEVEVGSVSAENTQITSGVNEGDNVIILPPANIKEGEKIKTS